VKAISIFPTEGGWMLRSNAIENELFFKSGASAESAAVRLAQGLADVGEEAQVEIYLRDGSLGRRFAVPALRRISTGSAAAAPSA
jgi:hypothetical protein